MSFPTSKSLQCKFLVQMRGLLCGQRRILRRCAGKTEEKKRLSARCAPVDGNTRAPASKSPGRKFRIDFSPISGELAGRQVG
jgi:hypothetical protein